MKSEYFIEETTITSGTDTDAINLKGKTLVGIFIPASVASSSFTLKNAINQSDTPDPVYDGLARYGAVGDVTVTISAGKYVALPPELTAGLINVTIVFSSSESSKTYKLVTREIE